MSMYTHLLDAAFEQRGPVLVRPTEHSRAHCGAALPR